MPFTVVNTIHIPDIDFGNHLVESLGAQVISAPARTEEELIQCTSYADGVVCESQRSGNAGHRP